MMGYKYARLYCKAGGFYLSIVALLWLAGCGGLAAEQPIVATFQPAAPATEDIVLPSAPPDLALGAQIFADNCAACHGIGGQGNGSLVVSGQLPQAPPDFTDQAAVRAQS